MIGNILNFGLYLAFGLSPSIIWLFVYLKKDPHPESKQMIVRVFFLGILSAVLAAAAQVAFSEGAEYFGLENSSWAVPAARFFAYNFFLIALTEEFFKYFVVKAGALRHTQFDEPVDVMIYMVTSALGFAALENLLYILPYLLPDEGMTLGQAAAISIYRFLGANLLHTFASAIIGFFMAVSFCLGKRKLLLAGLGIILASCLHGLFNVSIIGIEESLYANNRFLLLISSAALVAILGLMAFFVSLGFKRLKQMASICKL